MLAKTFPRGGGQIPHCKSATDNKEIIAMPAPNKVFIPMQQHIGTPCLPLVEPGDRVKVGQKIGESDSYISAAIHSSISGKILALEDIKLVNGQNCKGIIIENDFKDEKIGSSQDETAIEQLTREQVIDKVKEAGIVGMGGAGFPTHVKLAVSEPLDTVIINGAECEPYLTCDHRLLMEKCDALITGLRAMMKAVGAQTGVIGIENNKLDAIAKVTEKIKTDPQLKVIPLNVKYPQGAEKQLIKAVTGREVPSGELPLKVGCIVSNVHTSIAVFQALNANVSSYERVITVAGKHVYDPRNVLVRIGTPINEVLEFCGGVAGEPAVIISGGPMTGVEVVDLNAPITKHASGILALSEDEVFIDENYPCIRCAKCVDACPMGLSPNLLGLYSNIDKLEKAAKLHLMDCIECGLCSFVCPARRGLVTWIKDGKKKLIAKKVK